jgi:hypothetical protein
MRCPFCLQEAYVVEVHGHTQCAKCRNPIQRCCEGEVCDMYEEDSSALGAERALSLHQKTPSGVQGSSGGSRTTQKEEG